MLPQQLVVNARGNPERRLPTPKTTLDLPFRFQPSCGAFVAPCTWTIKMGRDGDMTDTRRGHLANDGGVGVKPQDWMDGGEGTDTCRNDHVVRNCENII